MSDLIDSSGRKIRKLRLSLLDACQFRCFYCMPKDVQFMSPKNYLTPMEIFDTCQELVRCGIEQIRMTGGEPTLRRDFQKIVGALSQLPLKKLAMTTNGYDLDRHLDFLMSTQCHSLNVSLDSLNEERFNKMVSYQGFRRVLSSILKAKEMGFNVKLNTVVIGGINDDELIDFVDFSARHQIEVRFLELMKIGQVWNRTESQLIPAREIIRRVSNEVELHPAQVDFDSTSFNFTTSHGARIGFIASETEPFCHTCSRIRLSADGFLRACLMSEKGVSIRSLDPEELSRILRKVMEMKPYSRIEHIKQDMYQIGG